MRTPTQQESDVFQKFCEANGIELTEANALRLGEPILLVGQQVTQGTLKASFEMVKGQLTYISAAQQEHDQVAALFTEPQLDAFTRWYAGQRLVQEGDPAFENKAALLHQLQGRAISKQTCAEAMGRLFNNATHRLHVLAEPSPESFGRHTKAHFENQPSAKLTLDSEQTWDQNAEYVNGRRRHTTNPVLQEKPSTPTQAHYEQQASAVRGDTHAETAALLRLFQTRSGLRMSALSSDVDWKATLELRLQQQRQMRMAKERGR